MINDQKVGAGSISNRILYIISLDHFVNDGSTFLVSSLFPAMEVAFGFSTYSIGILVAIGYVINMLFQPYAGRFLQKLDAKYLLSLGIGLMAISMVLFAVSGTFVMMVVSIVILRFGSSFFHPIGVSVVSRNYSGSKLDTSMGFESAFGNLGIVFAFVLSAPLYLALGWSGPFLIYTALEVGTVLITLTSLNTGQHDQKKSEVIPDTDGFPEEALTIPAASKRHLLVIPMFFIVTGFISGGSNSIFGNFGNLLLYHSGFSLTESNDLIAIWVASAFVGAIISGWLVKKLTRIRLLAASYIVSAACTFAFAFSGHSVYLAVASLLAGGFALSITYPATYSELSDYVGHGAPHEGASFGILFSSQIAGASLLGFLSGYLSRIAGLQLSFEFASVLLLLSALIVYIWKWKYRPSF